LKSNASDYMKLMQHIYDDACIKCTADVSDIRDWNTIQSRVKDEGLSFLTITLPNFSRDFEQALEIGRIDSSTFRNFRKVGSIPAFLQGMISQIFDRETGELKKHESLKREDSASLYDAVVDTSTVVESVRQICRAFAKLEVPCSDRKVKAAFDKFASTEHELSTFSIDTDLHATFSRVCSVLWDNMVAGFKPTDWLPRHGPGVTAERISGNQKYVHGIWHDRLEPYFPLIDNAYPMGSLESEEFLRITIVPGTEEQPVRVVAVPKTLKAPRIIAIEPVCMQYVQQGIREYLYSAIESYWLTRGHINFRDQRVNQVLAMKSSRDGFYATLDLSDASDRVPLSLVRCMFQGNADLWHSIVACRSETAQLPNGDIIALSKFASMGSALCFPVEAMYFYTICIVALLGDRRLSCTPANIFNVSRDVYVYGDDIIVPSTNAVVISRYLHEYNCRVNPNKSFRTGRFRESCGVDAYDGYNVTPTYVRQVRPANRRAYAEYISWSAMAKQFYCKGYWRTAQYIYNILERELGVYPYLADTSPGVGRFSFLYLYSFERWNKDLHRPEVKAMTTRPIYRTDKLEGYGALMKFFLQREVSEDKYHLERTALHGAATLKRRWVPPS